MTQPPRSPHANAPPTSSGVRGRGRFPPPPAYLPALIVVTFLTLCVLAVAGHVDMENSATAALVGVILGGLLDVIRTVVRYYFAAPESPDATPPTPPISGPGQASTRPPADAERAP